MDVGVVAMGLGEPVFFGNDLTLGALTIPLACGVIGLLTNWVCVQMMFHPMRFIGIRLPFTVKGLPLGGWQGIFPLRAGLMASVICDTAIMKLGSLEEFYRALEPGTLATRMSELARPDIARFTDEIIQREYPDLWDRLPDRVKVAIHARVEAELPAVIGGVLDDLGANIEKLVDLKLLVIRFMEENPHMVCRIFEDAGGKEFSYIVRAGCIWGVPLGVLPLGIYLWAPLPALVTVPIGSAIVGYMTNWIALKRIFEPDVPKRFFGMEFLGLFIKRQPEVSKVFAEIVAHRVLTIPTLVGEMFTGPDRDRTRRLVYDSVRPVVVRAVGVVAPMLDAVAGRSIDHMVADFTGAGGTVDVMVAATMGDDEFLRTRQQHLAEFMEERMTALPGNEFCAMLRAGIKKDEWMLTLIGAVLGLFVGTAQALITLV